MKQYSHWLIPLPAILFAIWPTTVNATPVAGLNAVGYLISGLPTKSDIAYPQCGSELENNINRNFDGEPFQQCGNDNFMVHYTGAITIPENQTISFMVAADDGGTVKIGDTAEFGTWNFKGCSWSTPTSFALPAATYPLDGWFFESGGYACYMLAWNINGAGFQIVPDSAFSTEPTATTTTEPTTTTATTTTSSTSTLPEETSTSTTTTQPTPTTTTTTITIEVQTPPQTTTTSSTSTTTTSTSTTTIPSTTTTATPKVEMPQPQIVETTEPPTTTTEPPTTTIQTTTTTTEPATTTTQTTSTTVLPDPVQEPVAPASTTIPATSVPATVPYETEQPTSTTQPQEYTPQTTVLEAQNSSPITITNQITNEQIIEIVTDPETFKALTVDQAEQLFEELDITELDNTELEAFTAAVQQAPIEVREAFEKTINIFGSQFEEYVPTGSNIPVKTRRTLVAAGALIMAVPSTRIRR